MQIYKNKILKTKGIFNEKFDWNIKEILSEKLLIRCVVFRKNNTKKTLKSVPFWKDLKLRKFANINLTLPIRTLNF